MKKLLYLLMLIPFLTIAQNENRFNSDAMSREGSTELSINYTPEHKGSPYLYDEWKEGYLVINDSIISPQEAIQVDLLNGDLIIASGNTSGIIVDDIDVTGFAINKDNSVNRRYFARINSSQFLDKNKTSQFYEVVSDFGQTNYLVKETQKYLFDPNRSHGYQSQNSIPQEYKERVRYFIKTKDGVYTKTKLNKKQILALFDDKSSELKAYAKTKKIGYTNENDVVKLINYYYSL